MLNVMRARRSVTVFGGLAPGEPESAAAALERRTFTGGDLGALQSILDVAFTPHETHVVGREPLDAHFEVVHSGNIDVYDLSYGTAVRILPVRPPDYYAVRIGHAGRASITHRGNTIPFSPTIVSPGQVVSTRWEADASARIMRIPTKLVGDALRGELGEIPGRPVQFENLLDVRIPEVRQWLRLASQFTTLIDTGVLEVSSLAASHFEQLLAQTMVWMAKHDRTDVLHARAGTAGPPTLRRAVAFCEDNAALPITVARIAEAASVSTRTLHELFRSHLGTTPLAHLRRVRLAGAHAELVAIAQGRATPRTIAHVAQRWGFVHAGRFSRAYRAEYGRFPNETMRQEGTG